MRRISILSLLFALSFSIQAQTDAQRSSDRDFIADLFDQALTKAETYKNLEHLCKQIGPRLSGSANAQKAVDWTSKLMKDYHFDSVWLQPVMVPHWERGEVGTAIISGGANLNILAIGGSIGTSPKGIEADIIEVGSIDELEEHAKDIKGKIVFFNGAFDQRVIGTGAGYGGVVGQRVRGASKASEYGALAVLVRSATSSFDDSPHTGTLVYTDDAIKIPAAALGFQSADVLQKAVRSGNTRVRLKLNCKIFPDAQSFNVVGEIKGSDFPEKVILVGGHLDSWDIGEGAHDDGAGCMQSIGVLRLLSQKGYRPRHTIRAVMFMNEENGLRGGKEYARIAKEIGEEHIIALESDAGGFTPRGIGVTGADGSLEKMRSWLELLDKRTLYYVEKGGGGADIGPLHRETGTPMAGFSPDSQRLFDVHHSENDVFEAVNRRELVMGTASLASFVYLIDKYGI